MDTMSLPKNMTEAEFDAQVTKEDPTVSASDLKKVKELYDPSVYPYPEDLGGRSIWWWMWTRVVKDESGLGACGTRAYSRDLLAGGTKEVHTYLFAKPSLTAP